MNKADVKRHILELEPANVVANAAGSSLAQLVVELSKIREQAMMLSSVSALPGTVRYRVEDDGFSWRIEAEDFLGDLDYGLVLPAIGTRIPNDEGDPIVLAEHEAGLAIIAGDLSSREKFDPRRIYITKSGNEVVFKRDDSKTGKPILWSFRQSIEIMVGATTILDRTDREAKPVAQSGLVMNQKNLSAYVIARNPSITGAELTAILREAFPNARVNDRHGPHYLSLSRNARLPEASDEDPRTWKK